MFKQEFADGVQYTQQDVAHAFERLTAQGVSTFPDTGNVLRDFNTAVSHLVTKGVECVQQNACRVDKEGDIYKIQPGRAFFDDGTVVEIDENGFVIVPDAGVFQYVSLHKTDLEVYPVISREMPDEEDILLASVDCTKQDPVVTDLRQIATEKLLKSGANTFLHMEKELHFYRDTPNPLLTFSVGSSDWNYMYVDPSNIYKLQDGVSMNVVYPDHSFEVIKKGDMVSVNGRFYAYNSNEATSRLCLYFF